MHLIRLLIITGLVAINFTALSLFIHTLHRIFASGPGDIGGVGALLAAVLGFVPIVQGARMQTNTLQTTGWHTLRARTGFLLGLNAAAVLGVLCLWQFALPWFSEHNYRKGNEYNQQGNLNKAIEHFDRSIYQHSDNPTALLSLATLYEEIKDDKKAKQYYGLAVRHEAAPFTALNNLARLYINTDEHDEAIALLLRAQAHLWRTAQPDDDRLNVRQGVISKNLAWAYWIAKDTALAEQAVSEAASTLALAGAVSDYPEIYCLRALLLAPPHTSNLVKACEMGYAKKAMTSLDIGLLRQARKHNNGH